METVKALLKAAVHNLKDSESATPVLDAELLMVHAMGEADIRTDRSKLILMYDEILPDSIALKFRELVERRKLSEPVQYITGRQEFMGLELNIQKGVLIPRPDTEIIVEKAVELSKNLTHGLNIIDMCTGSGAIAVSLAYYIKDSRVFAADISDAAVDCSGGNAEKHSLTGRITVVKSDLFDQLVYLKNSTDMIVSNPPYIPSADIGSLAAGVRDFEPEAALDGGIEGLDFYRRIIYNSVAYLKCGGILVFETGYNQGHAVKRIFEENGCYRDIGLEKDLAGYDRCIWAYRI